MTTYQVFNDQQSQIASVASADTIPIFDASTGLMKKATMAQVSSALPLPNVEEHTASGAVTAGIQSVEINSVAAIALTIADTTNHPGLFIVKHTSSSNGQSHTLTLTSGTYDGTNDVALLNAANEALVVFFDSAGNGTIVENVGSVSLGAS